MLKECKGIKIGDKVKVINKGKTYDTFTEMYNKIKNDVDLDCGNFIFGDIPRANDIGTVMGMTGDIDFTVFVLIKVQDQAYVIGIDGLEKVEDNTQVYFILDVSGSMDSDKRRVAKDIYNQYKKEYKNIKIITHTSEAKFSKIDELDVHEQGGTYLNSGLSLAITDSISNGYRNCTFVQVCDGDNWSEDNERFLNSINFIKGSNHKYHYFEILPSAYSTTMYIKINNKIGISDNVKTYKFKSIEEFRSHYNLDPLKKYIVYQVEHKVSGKLYQFRSQYELRRNEMVTCATAQGNTYGRIKRILTKEMTEEEHNKLSLCEYIK